MTSDGKSTFSIEPTEYNMSGTEITLSIKKNEDEFLSKYRIEEIVKNIQILFHFLFLLPLKKKKKKDKGKEQVNSAEAIWLQDKTKIKEDEYKSFFNETSTYYDEPLQTIHFKAEGVGDYSFISSKISTTRSHHPDRKNKLKSM